MKYYACIDLKSFFASCECVERKLDPLTTNLVVADSSRTEKTICLAVTPPLKSYGLSGRSRLYEVVQKVQEINLIRKKKNNNKDFIGKSYNSVDLKNNDLEVSYIIAPPRMALYMKYSADIYGIYLNYVSKDDIFAYSIDEVFCDITNYLKLYKKGPEELVSTIIKDVYEKTGITATGGVGTNLYLAKIAMDIDAKHREPDENGVRISFLDEMSYRKRLWSYEPLTDFWRIGVGLVNRLKTLGLYTMGDIARYSLNNEDDLYQIFGVNAELIIDHAWGYEPCTLKDVKNYKPSTTSLSEGQVLKEPYSFNKTKLIVREMAETLTLSMVKKGYVTDTIVLTIGYDVSNLKSHKIMSMYTGVIEKDRYGRSVPKSDRGTIRINHKTSSTKIITDHLMKLFDKIANPILLVRRINIAVCDLSREEEVKENKIYKQFDLFGNQEEYDENMKIKKEFEEKEKNIQKTLIELKEKYGKNSILKGMDLEEGATAIERNKEIGGHRSG